jgi:hypothetical protein
VARKVPEKREKRLVHRIIDSPDATLVDILDHVLNKGVVASGDVTLGVAGIDLIYLRLSALLCAVDRVMPAGDGQKRRRVRRRK